MQLVVSALTLMSLATPLTPVVSEPTTAAYGTGLQIAQASRAEEICVDAVRSSGYRVNNFLSTNTFSGGAEVIMEVQDRNTSYVVGCDYSDNSGRIELYQLDDGYRYSDSHDESGYSNRDNRCNGNGYGDCYNDRNDRYDDQYNSRYESRYERRYDDRYDDRYNDDWYEEQSDEWRFDDWRERYPDSSGVRSEGDAEEIARGVVGDQLGISDPYSDVVRIDDVRQISRAQDWVVEGRANGAPFVVKIRSSDAYVLEFELY